MYNCALHRNWEIGDKVEWVETHDDGATTIHVAGELLEYTSYRILRFSISHKGAGLKGQCSELRFSITPHTEGVLLTIKQGNFSSFPQAEEIHAECQPGWLYVQQDLKKTCLNYT